MKLLILNSCVSGGGAGRSLEAYFKHISPEIDAHVVMPEPGVIGETLSPKANLWFIPEFVERIHRSPYKLRPWLNHPYVHILINLFVLGKAAKRISTLAKEIKPDTIYCNHMLANPVGAYIGWKLNIPVVFHARNIHVAWFGRLSYTFLAKLDGVKAIICNSEASAELFLRTVPEKVKIIHNFLDTSKFDRTNIIPALRQEYAIPSNAIVAGYLGRILPKKGVDVLIRAFQKVYERCPNLYLVILGGNDGGIKNDLQSEYRDLCDTLGIGDRVIFTGFKKDIRPYMVDFDFVVLPSVEPESFGRVLIEGMAYSIPSITTDIGGAVEVIKHQVNGLHVPPRDATILAQALETLASDHEFRKNMGKRGHDRLLTEFSSHVLADQISNVFTGSPQADKLNVAV